jgi:GNAT superfamily N-acetyltransferase
VYEIIPYDSRLKGQIADLQRHLWRGDVALNTAHLEWKYEQNPYFETPLIHVAVCDDRVVGMRGMFGSQWELGSPAARFAIPAADDLVIAPDHRNRGLLTHLITAALDDLAARGQPYTFSLNPTARTIAALLTRGWRSVQTAQIVHRRASPEGLVAHLRARLRRTPLLWRYADVLPSRRPFARFDRQGRRGRAGADGRITVEAAPRVQAMAELVRRLGHDGRLRHVRDERYLAWRFGSPLHHYRFLYCEGGQLEGYLVLQAYRLGQGVNLVDWEATTPRVRADLLRSAIEGGRFRDLTAWATSGEGGAPLRAAGFVPVPTRPLATHLQNVLIRPVGPGPVASEPMLAGRRLLDPATWDMRMLYAMAG